MVQFVKSVALPFLASCLFTFVLASTLHSAFVLKGLIDIGINVRPFDALTMLLQDMLGLLPTYGVIILLTLALAFSFARFSFLRHTQRGDIRLFTYALAGAVGFLVMLSAMQPILNVTLIAGARGITGLLAQCAAGCMGGLSFAVLTR